MSGSVHNGRWVQGSLSMFSGGVLFIFPYLFSCVEMNLAFGRSSLTLCFNYFQDLLFWEYLSFFRGKSAISQQISLDSFIFHCVNLCGCSSAGVIYGFLEHPPFPRRHCLSPAVTSGKFMKCINSFIYDDVTLFKGNDSSTYCQYFKLKVPNLTLNGYHLGFFLIDHIGKLYHFVIPQSQSSEIMKSTVLQVLFAQLTLSSAKKTLLSTPPLRPKAQRGSRTWAQSPHGLHNTSLVCSFCNRLHYIW